MEDGDSRDSTPKESPIVPIRTRSSLKSDSHFNKYHIWKDTLRENCYRRVREDRTRLLWKMRLPTAQPFNKNQEGFIISAFRGIVSDELKKIKDSTVDDYVNIPPSASEINDMLWEYDGLHNSYQGECEDIMLEMQRIFYEDPGEEPTRKGSESLATLEEEEDDYLSHAIDEHMKLNEDQAHRELIWCPICKQGNLKEDYHYIYCTHCELQLSKANELNLDLLRNRLAEAHIEHLDRGCRLTPKFCIETRFGLTALYISCWGCDTFEVVI
ncbi:RPA-interacting protein [Quillaja saponaria]|uniref:RPA-interacting protein n=1 Tax=Quillaja saponaria TaxID=32244 RepID=A0AAD7LPJ8_QUISA|nr:RPA-interacting protein [Quillaja saponaria]